MPEHLINCSQPLFLSECLLKQFTPTLPKLFGTISRHTKSVSELNLRFGEIFGLGEVRERMPWRYKVCVRGVVWSRPKGMHCDISWKLFRTILKLNLVIPLVLGGYLRVS